jgi:AcrR family transcriptional regulator
MAPANRRDTILAVSARLFAEKGYGNTTTAEIARESGVAEGTLYHHFANKDDIFLTLFSEVMDGFLAGATAISVSGSGKERLSAYIRFHFDYLEKNQARILILQRDFPPHLAAPGGVGRPAFILDKLSRITDLLAIILDRGKKDGTLTFRYASRDAAELLRGILTGCTRQKVLGIITIPVPKLAAMVESFCMESLAADHTGGTSVKNGGAR